LSRPQLLLQRPPSVALQLLAAAGAGAAAGTQAYTQPATRGDRFQKAEMAPPHRLLRCENDRRKKRVKCFGSEKLSGAREWLGDGAAKAMDLWWYYRGQGQRVRHHPGPACRLEHPLGPFPSKYLLNTSRIVHAHPTSPRSTGFCTIWGCISLSSSSSFVDGLRKFGIKQVYSVSRVGVLPGPGGLLEEATRQPTVP